MVSAEGRMFSFESEKLILTSVLEPFVYQGERQYITYDTQEFSCVCPFSGLPDYGRLIIEYVPGAACVELKSLKYYLVSFRNVGIYQEAAINRIFQDLYRLLEPTYMKVTLSYRTRGGIDSTCAIEQGVRDGA